MFPVRILIVAGMLCLCGCAHQAAGDAAAELQSGQCQAGTAQLTPPVLYGMMVSCVQQQDYAQAVQLYALAGSYSHFDALRINSPWSRQQHHLLLSQALQQLEPEQRDTFWQLLRPAMENRAALAATCQNVRQTGAPVYQQNYSHDPQWSAARPADSSSWSQAVNRYLHCP